MDTQASSQNRQITITTSREGFTLLITILIMGLLLAISGSLMHVTLKQYQLSGIALASEMAFQAANAGIECAQYYDLFRRYTGTTNGVPNAMLDSFRIGGNTDSITCMGQIDTGSVGAGAADSKEAQIFEFSWGTPTPQYCTKLTVIKYENASAPEPMAAVGNNRECPQGTTCTVVKSSGYNASCGDIDSNPRVVERELILVY